MLAAAGRRHDAFKLTTLSLMIKGKAGLPGSVPVSIPVAVEKARSAVIDVHPGEPQAFRTLDR